MERLPRGFQELLEQAPDSEIAREQLAKALPAQGQVQEAEQVLEGPLTNSSE